MILILSCGKILKMGLMMDLKKDLNWVMNFLKGYNFHLSLLKNCVRECSFRSNVMEQVNCCVEVLSRYWSAKAVRQVVSKYYSLEPGKYRSIFVESDGCMQVRYFCGCHYLAEDYYKFEELPGYHYSGYCPKAGYSCILEMCIPDPIVDGCIQEMCTTGYCVRYLHYSGFGCLYFGCSGWVKYIGTDAEAEWCCWLHADLSLTG